MRAPKTYAEAMALAEQLREREKTGVIERIKAAIAAYELTPDDLFDVPVKRRAAKKAKAKRQRQSYSDGVNTWSGFGRQPRWLSEALANGKTLDDLAV